MQPDSQGLCSSWGREIFGMRSSLHVDFSFFHCCSKKSGLTNKGNKRHWHPSYNPRQNYLRMFFRECALPYTTKLYPALPRGNPLPQVTNASFMPRVEAFFLFTASIPGGGRGKNCYGYDDRKILSKYAFSLRVLSMILAGVAWWLMCWGQCFGACLV